MWTYLLKPKREVGSTLTRFFTQVHAQFHKSIKTIRCDNGSEFSHPALFAQFGTIVQHSCVECPQQNARVERKHQHLLNVARSLYFQSSIPIGYWHDCILTASYLINRTPSSVLNHRSLISFEVLFNRKPTYSHLKVFGCLCFASTLTRDRTKLSPGATKCIFLGYPPGYKGYKVLDLETNKVFISRNVTFHESIFSFQNQSVSPPPFLLCHHLLFLILFPLLIQYQLLHIHKLNKDHPLVDKSNHHHTLVIMSVDLLQAIASTLFIIILVIIISLLPKLPLFLPVVLFLNLTTMNKPLCIHNGNMLCMKN